MEFHFGKLMRKIYLRYRKVVLKGIYKKILNKQRKCCKAYELILESREALETAKF
jgi:hypothetical protein